ncbi:MAG: hypothetical protein KDJ44_00655 [Rhodoblastus sp.]|nr:hypothetical protein [Rhodoblastus sp.]
MARMSIYVPDDLKGRMDDLESNWSAIAQVAFEREIRLHPKLTENEMQATIERLRASKKAQIDDVIQAGVEAGKKWAQDEAEYLDLTKVGRALEQKFAVKSTSKDEAGNETDTMRSFPKLSNGLLLSEAVAEGEHYEHGFCMGVLDVWKQVKAHLA